MKAEEYHLSLRSLDAACNLAGSGWVCIPNPLIGWGCEGSVRWKTGVLLRHVLLVFRCWRASRCRYILVREFSTLPLLLVFPLLWPLRRKLFFMIHHNLQWAVRSRIEHFGMVALARAGARWAIFETQDFQGLEVWSIPSPQNLVLPHPAPEKSAGKTDSSRPVIGVAGYYRPEKGMDELLRLLIKHFPDCDVVAGVPNPEAVKIPGVRVVGTAADEDYRAMLARCDVLVQNGERDSYFYRASGPLADAAASGTAVVVPDFPLLRHQVLSPVPVGEVFESFGEIPSAVRTAVAKTLSGQYDFSAYCAARSAQAVADRLDEFSRIPHG
jgi:glycosyltransferase involved in cell wall biosynthesis